MCKDVCGIFSDEKTSEHLWESSCYNCGIHLTNRLYQLYQGSIYTYCLLSLILHIATVLKKCHLQISIELWSLLKN